MSARAIRRLALLWAVSLALAAIAPAAGAADVPARDTPVEVALSRAQVATRLGQSFEFSSKITNTGSRPLSDLVAHLNIVGLSENIYVDPEDWSDERTRHLAALGPGQSTTLAWPVKAVTGGEAAIYVVVLPGKSPSTATEGLAVSPALDVRITERRTLNTGGVLWLALGVPALLGLATLVARRRSR